MDLKSEVGIISAFGRGHWLAVELAKHKIPVALLEVTHQMGEVTPEDAEGPFGFFGTEESFTERLTSDCDVKKLENGFVLWLSSGPVEFGRDDASERLLREKVTSAALDYVKGSGSVQTLKNLAFENNWPAHLTHAWTGNLETLAPEAFKEGLRRDLFSPFSIRQVTPKTLEKSLQWCEDAGVQVLRNVEIKDFVLEENQKTYSLEVRTDRPGLFKSEQIVFALSAEESGMVNQRLQSSLFGGIVIEPQWVWMRYRLKMQGQGPLASLARDQIPPHCLLIEDVMLPWTHENMMVLQRTSQKDVFDAWMKIPNSQRFHSQYLQDRADRMIELLEKRIPDTQVLLGELPLEAKSTFEQVGPARHPVYSQAVRSSKRRKSERNLHLDGPDQWESLAWEGQLAHQKGIFADLKAWWDRKEELRLKREAKEAAKRKSQGADL